MDILPVNTSRYEVHDKSVFVCVGKCPLRSFRSVPFRSLAFRPSIVCLVSSLVWFVGWLVSDFVVVDCPVDCPVSE